MSNDDLFSDILSQQESSVSCQSFFDSNNSLPDVAEILETDASFNQSSTLTDISVSSVTSSLHPQNLSNNSQCFSNQLNYSNGSTKPLMQYLGSTVSQATEYKILEKDASGTDSLEFDSLLNDLRSSHSETENLEFSESFQHGLDQFLEDNCVNPDINSVLEDNFSYYQDSAEQCSEGNGQVICSAETWKSESVNFLGFQEESSDDLVKSLFGNDPDLFCNQDERNEDPISLLDEIFDEIDTRKDKQEQEQINSDLRKDECNDAPKTTEPPIDTNNNEGSQKKRFDGTAVFKAVPAYERSLDPSETEEVPKAFQIPKLGKNIQSLVRVDPRFGNQLNQDSKTHSEVIKCAKAYSRPNSAPMSSSMIKHTPLPNATSLISVRPPIVQQNTPNRGSLVTNSINLPVPATNAASKKYNTVKRTYGMPSTSITPKLNELKATMLNQGHAIQDNQLKQRLSKRLKQLRERSRQANGYLRILPKGYNPHLSLLRSNVEKNLTVSRSVPSNGTSKESVSQVTINSKHVDPKAGIPSLLPWASNVQATQGIQPQNGLKPAFPKGPPIQPDPVQNADPVFEYGNLASYPTYKHYYPFQMMEPGALIPYPVYQDPILYCQAYQQALKNYNQNRPVPKIQIPKYNQSYSDATRKQVASSTTVSSNFGGNTMLNLKAWPNPANSEALKVSVVGINGVPKTTVEQKNSSACQEGLCDDCIKGGGKIVYIIESDEEDAVDPKTGDSVKSKCSACGKVLPATSISMSSHNSEEKTRALKHSKDKLSSGGGRRTRKCWNCKVTKCSSWFSHRKRSSTDLCGNCYTYFKSLSKSKQGSTKPETSASGKKEESSQVTPPELLDEIENREITQETTAQQHPTRGVPPIDQHGDQAGVRETSNVKVGTDILETVSSTEVLEPPEKIKGLLDTRDIKKEKMKGQSVKDNIRESNPSISKTRVEVSDEIQLDNSDSDFFEEILNNCKLNLERTNQKKELIKEDTQILEHQKPSPDCQENKNPQGNANKENAQQLASINVASDVSNSLVHLEKATIDELSATKEDFSQAGAEAHYDQALPEETATDSISVKKSKNVQQNDVSKTENMKKCSLLKSSVDSVPPVSDVSLDQLQGLDDKAILQFQGSSRIQRTEEGAAANPIVDGFELELDFLQQLFKSPERNSNHDNSSAEFMRNSSELLGTPP